jgi:hypothetical protein
MRTILSLSFLVGVVVGRPSKSLLRPLPKHYDAGDAAVVFINDRMNVLPPDFEHTEDGMLITRVKD